jgi:hypothetical protein
LKHFHVHHHFHEKLNLTIPKIILEVFHHPNVFNEMGQSSLIVRLSSFSERNQVD